MNKFPVGEALNVDFDNLPEIVPSIKGTLKELYKPKEFTTQRGDPSSRQNGVLNTQNGPIRFTIFGNSEIPLSMRGKAIEFRCSKGKGGLGGIDYKINEYNGNKNEELVLSYRAEYDVPEAPKKASTSQGALGHQSTKENDSRTFKDAIDELLERQSLVDYLVRSHYQDRISEETLCSYVMNIVITAERLGGYMLPIEPGESSKEESAPQCDPDNWAEAIIPSGPNAGKTLASIGKQKIFELDRYREEKGKTGGFWECVKNAASILSFSDGSEVLDDSDEIPF